MYIPSTLTINKKKGWRLLHRWPDKYYLCSLEQTSNFKSQQRVSLQTLSQKSYFRLKTWIKLSWLYQYSATDSTMLHLTSHDLFDIVQLFFLFYFRHCAALHHATSVYIIKFLRDHTTFHHMIPFIFYIFRYISFTISTCTFHMYWKLEPRHYKSCSIPSTSGPSYQNSDVFRLEAPFQTSHFTRT